LSGIATHGRGAEFAHCFIMSRSGHSEESLNELARRTHSEYAAKPHSKSALSWLARIQSTVGSALARCLGTLRPAKPSSRSEEKQRRKAIGRQESHGN